MSGYKPELPAEKGGLGGPGIKSRLQQLEYGQRRDWKYFEQGRHRMQPPDSFNEHTKKFEKFEKMADGSQRPDSSDSTFPEVSAPTPAAVAAAQELASGSQQQQRQLDADLSLRKAHFFNNCLRADRAVDSPRKLKQQVPMSARGVRGSEQLKQKEIQMFLNEVPRPASGGDDSPRSPASPGVPEEAWAANASFESDEAKEFEDEEPKNLTLEEAMGGLVDQCRRARLHPATTGIVRATGHQKLQLEYGFLTDARAEAMNDSLKAASSDVREALFRSNGLTETGAATLLQALPIGVEHIDLSQNDLSHGQTWCRSFKKMESLKFLILSDCQISDAVCKELIESLVNCKKLAKLDLSCNRICTAGASIRSLAKGYRTLEELDLHWNLLSGDGAKAVVQGIIENSKAKAKLHKVSLSWNPLGKSSSAEELCQLLASLFAETTVLRHVDLSKCELSRDCCKLVAEGFNQNGSILGLHLSGNEGRVDPLGFLRPDERGVADQEAKQSADLADSGAQVVRDTSLAMEQDACCWVCNKWRETRMSYVSGVSGPAAEHVWVFTAIDGFQAPIKMQKIGEEFVAYVMAEPGPLRYCFQVGTEILYSRTSQEIEIEEMLLAMRGGIGLYSATSLYPKKVEHDTRGSFTVLPIQREKLSGEVTEDENGEKLVDLNCNIDIFNTMMVVARPEDEAVCCALVPRHLDELRGDFPPEEWSIERSLFAPHHEALSIPAFCERCFESDWRLAEIESIVKDEADRTVSREAAKQPSHVKDVKEDRAAVREVLQNHYAEMKVLYSSLCSVDWALVSVDGKEGGTTPHRMAFGVGINEFSHMIVQHNLAGEVMSVQEADAHFILAALPHPDSHQWLPAFQMEGRMLQRHSFFGLLVRLAASHARNSAQESGSKSKAKQNRIAKALQYLLNKHIMYPYPPMKNNFKCVQWRVDVLHTQVVEAVFRKHMKAVVDPLFAAYSRTDTGSGLGRPHLRPEDWFQMLDALGVLPIRGVENAQMNVWDRAWLWQASAMTQIDELSSSRCIELLFVEFLEALARLVALLRSREYAAQADGQEGEGYGLDDTSASTVFCLDKGVLDKTEFAEHLDSFLSSKIVHEAVSISS
mmetsp:Transcript_106320/g.189065  ORF Transcript_106320/g.189065 Transcript_106320/m.189065 type:complete len:1104 (-) Transcript_106320:126-3437(-)